MGGVLAKSWTKGELEGLLSTSMESTFSLPNGGVSLLSDEGGSADPGRNETGIENDIGRVSGLIDETHLNMVGKGGGCTVAEASSASTSASSSAGSVTGTAVRLVRDRDCFLRRRLIVSACADQK